ncbi:hypothetical protein E3N88_40022 [Mikania micrantha]|uniref:Uncharacterized protein n=1 Tax=Mikania micrantha TaxID=192012 RepID=A0A5N6LLH7_9ASTR|nr:hypothetical protein E3N88_40022 [Mikania micrantha]
MATKGTFVVVDDGGREEAIESGGKVVNTKRKSELKEILEEVIKHFMDLSTMKAELARSQAHALQEGLDVNDLQADKRPEYLILNLC